MSVLGWRWSSDRLSTREKRKGYVPSLLRLLLREWVSGNLLVCPVSRVSGLVLMLLGVIMVVGLIRIARCLLRPPISIKGHKILGGLRKSLPSVRNVWCVLCRGRRRIHIPFLSQLMVIMVRSRVHGMIIRLGVVGVVAVVVMVEWMALSGRSRRDQGHV